MMNAPEKITLTELQGLIRDKIYEALPESFWVVAEIAEMKVHTAGHCYLELTGSDTPGGRVTAKARATIWASKYRSLNTFFTATTGIPLRAGITILLKATVEYHELYGLSLNVTDIDPAYTAGDMALKREAIIRQLTEDGVINMNSELSLAPYTRHIAVISSSGAAGYQDFINHLVHNPYGYVYIPQLFGAVMQGEATESSVIDALNLISEEAERYDVVVIIRGGGSTTDLSWFDSYEIAYHVTQFPLPVLTGIGHERDRSVTDMVAWKSLKTPTAVADFLVERTIDCENRIIGMAESLTSAVTEAIDSAGEQLSSLQNRTAATARLVVRVKHEKLGYHIETLRRSGKNVLRSAKEVTDRLEDSMRHLDPSGVMRRGFTLTTRNGQIVRSPDELEPGDTITTHFQEGMASSTIKKITKNK
ncbi:MAG: exodeoxyribonuclease VII large subunit [Bacteroidales bacterium]|jgi:exodeoxyribonuclease VII large subunit|nr:exodeoxyribonuclease VII large subunit [Bacteroidales bacterium]